MEDFVRYTFDLGWREIHPHPHGEFVSAWQTARALRWAASMLADAGQYIDADEVLRLAAQLETWEEKEA